MKKRKSNLDLLRILSMFFIVSLHYLGVGGSFYNIYDGNTTLIDGNYCLASWLEALSIVGVNCFVLISGYFLINSSFKWKKIGQIYLTTIFYSVILFLIHVIFYGFSLGDAVSSFLPVLMSTYWFITVYLVLYLLSPYINILCNHLSKKQHLTLILILVAIFSVWKCVLPIAETIDNRKGYSLTWFIVLYVCGAYISKYGIQGFKRNIFNLLSYFGISIVMVLIKIAAIVASTKFAILANGQNLFYHYDSITVFAASIFLFIFFSRIECNSAFLGKAVEIIAPSTFSVYLIHENFLWREIFWNQILKANVMTSSPFFILHFLLCVVGVFVVCVLIDQIRKIVFLITANSIKRLKRKEK